MERLVDKTIVILCCLLAAVTTQAAQIEQATSAMQATPTVQAALSAQGNAPEVPLVPATLVGMMLLAIISAAIYECARRTTRPFAPLVYCAAICFVPAGAIFLPLAAYDLTRNIHDASPARFSLAAAAVALAVALFRTPYSSLTLFALVCALAVSVALSTRTNKLVARQSIARHTRDNLQAQAIGLKAENASLVKKLKEAAEKEEEEAHERKPSDAATRPAVFVSLTEREYEVALLIAQGLDNREIAACAYMSEGTVRNHVSSILAKTNLKNRTQIAVAYYTSIM